MKKNWLKISVPVFLLLLLATFISWAGKATAGSSGPVYKALNPRGVMGEIKVTTLAPRLESLNGKVIYCVSQHVGDADTFLKKVADALPEYAPGAKGVFKSKPAVYMSDDKELWDEIAKEADALIYGCAA